MGSPEFVESQRRLVNLGPDAFLKSILKKSHASIDEWQTQMQLKPMAIGSISLCSKGLSDEDRKLTGVRVVESLDDAVSKSLTRGDGSVAVVPEGPYVVPFFQPPIATGT
jgi:hypothetical protein